MDYTWIAVIIVLFVSSAQGFDCICRGNKFVHLWGYNGDRIDFKGDCRYTLAEVRDTNDACYFHVLVDNWNPTGASGRSMIRFVEVIFGVDRMRLSTAADRMVRINDWESMAPAVFPVAGKGNAVLIQTGLGLMFEWPDCQLKVTVDQDLNLAINIDSTRYENKVHGICGTCNVVKNEYFMKNRLSVADLPPPERSLEIARSFTVIDYFVGRLHQCKTTSIDPACDATSETNAASSNYCGKIQDKHNDFGGCILDLSQEIKDNLYEDCKQDFCTLLHDSTMQKQATCNVLQIMARICAEISRSISTWRSPNFCPLSCPKSSTYSDNMIGCPRTCRSETILSTLACVGVPSNEGCQCQEGMIIDSGREFCVSDPNGCGCVVNGQRYYSKFSVFIHDLTDMVKYCDSNRQESPFTNLIPCASEGEFLQLDSYKFGYCKCPLGYNYGEIGKCTPAIQCSAGSHFTISLNSCRATCKNPKADQQPDCTATSQWGCACDNGRLYDEDEERCLLTTECGCYDTNDNRRPIGMQWLRNDCTQKFECVQENGLPSLKTKSHSCPTNSYCDVSGPTCVCNKYYLPVQHNDQLCEQPIQCPANGHYSPSSPKSESCRATCSNPTPGCSPTINHGCKCLPGYYFADSKGSNCRTCTCGGGGVHSTADRVWNAGCTQMIWCDPNSNNWQDVARTCGKNAHCEISGESWTCVCNTGYIAWLDSDVAGGGDCIPLALYCGPNKRYNPAGSKCPNTCSKLNNVDSCIGNEPSCECVAGFILARLGGDCILPSDCSCTTPENFQIDMGGKAMNNNCSILWRCLSTMTGTVLKAQPAKCGTFTTCNTVAHVCMCQDSYSPSTDHEAVKWGDNCEALTQCLDVEVYDPQASACPNSCSNNNKENSCALPPRPGCRCVSTHWRRDDNPGAPCVPKTQCGCLTMSNDYRLVGESWVGIDCITYKCNLVNGVPTAQNETADGCPIPYSFCNTTDPTQHKCSCIVDDTRIRPNSATYINTTDPVTGKVWCQRELNSCSVSLTQMIIPFDHFEEKLQFRRHKGCTWTMMEVEDVNDPCYISVTMKGRPPVAADGSQWVDHIRIIAGTDRVEFMMKWGKLITINGSAVVYDQNDNKDAYYFINGGERILENRIILSRRTRDIIFKWEKCGDFRVVFIQLANRFPTIYLRNYGPRWHGKVWGVCGNGNTDRFDVEAKTHGTDYDISNLPRDFKYNVYMDSFRVAGDSDCPICSTDAKNFAKDPSRCGKLTDTSAEFQQCLNVLDQDVKGRNTFVCEYAVCEYYGIDSVQMHRQICSTIETLKTECSKKNQPVSYSAPYCKECKCRRQEENAGPNTYNTYDGGSFEITTAGLVTLSTFPDENDECYFKVEADFQFLDNIYKVVQMKVTATPNNYVVDVTKALFDQGKYKLDEVETVVNVDYDDVRTNIKVKRVEFTHFYVLNSLCDYLVYTNFRELVVSVGPWIASKNTGLCGSCDYDPTNDI